MGRMTDQEIMVADGCRLLQMVADGCIWPVVSLDFSEFELLNTPRNSEIHNSQQAFLVFNSHMT